LRYDELKFWINQNLASRYVLSFHSGNFSRTSKEMNLSYCSPSHDLSGSISPGDDIDFPDDDEHNLVRELAI